MKRLLCLLIGLLPFGLNANEMKVPFSVPVDLSKKGAVYETDFQAPWNIWGSEVIFAWATSIKYNDLDSPEFELQCSLEFGTRNNIPISKEENQYFKLKVTLTPLGWATENIEIKTIDYSKEGWLRDESQYGWLLEKDIWKKKEYKDDEKIEFIVSIPLYGGNNGMGGKTIMIADLQRLKNYHINVESLEDIELPTGVKTSFAINRFSTKH